MLCPECQAGKHPNCNGRSWDNEKDDFVVCPCPCRVALARAAELLPIVQVEG